jgi:hypothetical protein
MSTRKRPRTAELTGSIVAIASMVFACAGGQSSRSSAHDVGDGTDAVLDSSSTAAHADAGDTNTGVDPDGVDVPEAPTGVTVVPGATSIEVSWSPSDAGPVADDYRILLDGSEAAFVTAPDESTTLMGLDPATRYAVSVVAVNAGGDSPSSPVVDTVTEFSPSAFTNTQFWFDADDASTFTLVEDRVASWRDKSGNENNAFQAIDSLRPTRVNQAHGDRATVRFDDAYLTTTDIVQLRERDDGYTIIAVVMNTKADGITGTDGRGGVLLGNFGSSQPNVAVELHEDRELRQWWDTRDEPGLPAADHTGDARFPSPRPAANTYAIVLFYRDAAARKFGGGVDGVLAAELEDEGPNLTVAMPFRIGGDYRASPLPVSWNGDIAEMLVFDRLLSSDERDRLHDYMSFKWSVALD